MSKKTDNQVQQDAIDAARYRKYRDMTIDMMPQKVSPEEFDATIDAANFVPAMPGDRPLS